MKEKKQISCRSVSHTFLAAVCFSQDPSRFLWLSAYLVVLSVDPLPNFCLRNEWNGSGKKVLQFVTIEDLGDCEVKRLGRGGCWGIPTTSTFLGTHCVIK